MIGIESSNNESWLRKNLITFDLNSEDINHHSNFLDFLSFICPTFFWNWSQSLNIESDKGQRLSEGQEIVCVIIVSFQKSTVARLASCPMAG